MSVSVHFRVNSDPYMFTDDDGLAFSSPYHLLAVTDCNVTETHVAVGCSLELRGK